MTEYWQINEKIDKTMFMNHRNIKSLWFDDLINSNW